MSETKTNFIMAVRGYKVVKKLRNGGSTDTIALDSSNKTVLLRAIEPLTPQYIGINEVKNISELINQEHYDSAILISKHFTDNAIDEMSKQKIEHVSDEHMPAFGIQELYQAVLNTANNLCQKKCGTIPQSVPQCSERPACKTKALVASAKQHLENGSVGLLKNDLRIAFTIIP